MQIKGEYEACITEYQQLIEEKSILASWGGLFQPSLVLLKYCAGLFISTKICL